MPGQHGFARNQAWTLTKTSPNTLECTLIDNESTLKVWPNKFTLKYVVKLTRETLETELFVENPNDNHKAFSFTALFHTYLSIGDISSLEVEGFTGLDYFDKLEGGKRCKETREICTISCEVDRTFISAPNKVTIKSNVGNLELSKAGLPDIVFWNPWIEKSKSMVDFDDDEVSDVSRKINCEYSIRGWFVLRPVT